MPASIRPRRCSWHAAYAAWVVNARNASVASTRSSFASTTPPLVVRSTMLRMPARGAPVPTHGRSELPGTRSPASRNERCRYSHGTRDSPSDLYMVSPIS